jgi:S1-C subfamily serine protease
MSAARPKTNEKPASRPRKAPRNLSQVAQTIAGEVAQGSKKTTLRRLLKRCGYERRNAATMRRLQAALDAAGVQCLPPPAGVEGLDDSIQLAPAAEKAAPRRRKTPHFSSREAMLTHAQRATVLIKLGDGHGSGFLIDKTGLILTARHVVENAEEVCVRYDDGKEMQARVLFSDVALDFAFVQGEARDDFLLLNPAIKLAVGQTLYAVGTPLQSDLAGSVSRGIVSGLDRVIGGVAYLQTDASIHAGHSGGPLLTEDGDVAGMNLWGRPEEGLRFALPALYAAQALQSLQPQLGDLEARLYCTDCGFLNGPESWLLCTSWLCCGRCGTVLGDVNAGKTEAQSACEDDEADALQNDQSEAP